MDNYQHFQDPPASSSEEDEITFLLRLKPAPTPPTRRRKNITAPKTAVVTTPKGWDVVIERRDVSSPNASSVCSSPVKQRRCSFEGKEGSKCSIQGEEKRRTGSEYGINCETGETNSVTTPLQNGFRCSNAFDNEFTTSPYVKLNPAQQVNFSKFSLDSLVHKFGVTTEEEDPPPVPPRFKPSAPPQEPDDNYYWCAPKPLNVGSGFGGCGDETRGVTGFSNYCAFPNGGSFGSANPNSALNLQYDPTLYSRLDQNRHSIVQTTALAQSISTYSIARPLSASGFYVGSGPVQTAPYPESGNSGIDCSFGGSGYRNSGGNLGTSVFFSPLSSERSSPVVGRPPKALPRSSFVERNVRDGICGAQDEGAMIDSMVSITQASLQIYTCKTATHIKKMREVCKSGAVVAAVVAVLEKQTRQFTPGNGQKSPPSKPPKILDDPPDIPPNSSSRNSRETRKPDSTTNIINISNKSGIKNRNVQESAAVENYFELAVKDFNTVAEDVEKTFCDESGKNDSVAKRDANSLKREFRSLFSAKKFESDDGTGKILGGGSGDCARVDLIGNGVLKIGKRTEVVNDSVGEVRRKNCVTIDLKSEEGELERNGNKGGAAAENEISTTTSNAKAPPKNNLRLNFERPSLETDELVVVLGYSGQGDIDSDSLEGSSDTEGEHFVNEGLATITEEERVSGGSALSFRGCEGDDSSIEDDSTLKDRNPAWSGSISNPEGSTSDVSTSSSERNLGTSGEAGSTRCTGDFQWIRKDTSPLSPLRSPPRLSPIRMEEDPHEQPPLCKPPISRSLRDKTRRSTERLGTSTGTSAPGSLDRRRHHLKREERDLKSRSSHVKSPPRLEDFQPNLGSGGCQNGYCCPPACGPYDGYFESFHRRHERSDPQRYGSSPMLMEHRDHRFSERGSHPDIYGDCTRYRHEMSCCSYHMGPPPCCFYGGERGYHWTPPPYPKPGEQDEKFRKMQYERDNLQLQVQVLTEQIEAQSDKITDLEKMLLEKKQMFADAEEKLQREVLTRSSLETQKLELMSIMSELKLNAAALERENLELRNSQYNNNADGKKPPLMPRMSSTSQPQLTSTPQHSSQGLRMSPSPSPVGMSSNSPRNVDPATTYQNEIHRPKTPPSSYKRQIDIQYGSLPRQQFLTNGSGSPAFSVVDSNANPQKRGVAFGRNSSLQHLPMVMGGGRMRGFSVPNLAETEKVTADGNSPKEDSPGSPTLTFNKNKGIKKIFGKMKRSGSGNLEDLPAGVGEFQRGGVRATAAARLGWSEPELTAKPDKPFAEWDTENICDWLQDMGLDQYIADAKRWVKTGQQLQESSITEIEKELNIKNPLHRKKLQLALIDTTENSSSDPFLSQAGKLDTAWVLRWLDDAGLPQHKESFLIHRVDGRVLHRLTMDDLALLHVTSLLHVASIKRGIQVLRENNYEPACLQRRSLPDDPAKPTPNNISLWTTHRVMEWLRAVDLAEYAPNLRGAGVHGGLMVLETKFTPDLLASLLSIPPGKTLLRRHLNTHFKELLGKDIIQEKRELEATMGYTPLTPSSKLKIAKKSQFSLKRKKSKGEADYGDLVCPLNPDKQSGELSSTALNMGTMTKKEDPEEEDVYLRADKTLASRSLPASVRNSPVTLRHV